jgi:hypothetical protein
MDQERTRSIVGRVLAEVKQFFWIFLYLWVLLGLFGIYKASVLHDAHLIYHQGFAIINALVLAKVMLTAEFLHVADNMKDKPLVYPIVFKSALFSAILMCFYLVEEILGGMWHGKSFALSIPALGGGDLKGILVVALIMFIVLTPFFAFRELGRVIGEDKLHSLIFQHHPQMASNPTAITSKE